MTLSLWIQTFLVFLCLLPFAVESFELVSLRGSLSGATLEYQINLEDPNANGQDTVTFRYTIQKEAWLGVGLSASGLMPGSEVVIGKPQDGTVMKYNISARNAGGVVAMPQSQQTLINTSLEQTGGTTVLTFTKIMSEAGELSINADGVNSFVAAFGFGNSFSFHQGYSPFSVTMSTEPATPTTVPSPTGAPANGPAPTNPPNGFQVFELEGQLEGSTLSYKINLNDAATGGKDSITMTLSAPTTGWVGVGISLSGLMLGSQAIIGFSDSGEVKKYDLNAKAVSGVAVMSDDKQTLVNTEVVSEGGMTTMTFTKILSEEGEIEIDAFGENSFIAAYGSSLTLGYHAARGSVTATGSARDSSLWKVHGALAAVAWAVLCPLAIMCGVFRKYIPGESLWFSLHRLFNGLTVLATIGAVIVAIVALNDETPDGFSAEHFSPDLADGHRLIGIIIGVFAFLQALNGALRPHLPPKEIENSEEGSPSSPPVAKSTNRKAWEVYHKLLGACLLGLSWYQVKLGIFWYNEFFNQGDADSTLNIFYAVIGVLGGLIVIGVLLRVVSSKQ